MELLKSLSRHLTVQKYLRLLKRGTLNWGRNLCVTVAIDLSTVDGFHDELQRSAKNTWGKALQRISWIKEFYVFHWNEYHSISVFDLLKFHQFGSTVLPESLLEYVWYAEREVWKGTLIVAHLEQVDKNRRVRIPQREAQREGDDLAQIGDDSQKPQMDNLKFIGGDQVLRTPILARYHPCSRRSSRRPSWRIRRVSTTDQSKKLLHINTVYTEISDILTKIASKRIWENLSWICSTSRLTPSTTGKTSCYSGPWFIDDLLLVKLVWYITSNIITAGKYRLNTDSSINWMWECRRASTERRVA